VSIILSFLFVLFLNVLNIDINSHIDFILIKKGVNKMGKIFSKNGLIVLGFDRELELTCQGTLEVYDPYYGSKFYIFTPSIQENSWVYIAYEKAEVIYGGTVVDFRDDGGHNDSPVYLLCLSDLALLKFIKKSYDEYWIFKEGSIIPVYKEWLIYFDLIPGDLEPGTVVEPPQLSDDIRERLLTIYYEG
jgi:hypothetical protein